MNLYKLKHFYLNKYIVSSVSKRRYFMSYDYKHKVLWFRNYKVASRTINEMLQTDSKKGQYIYASQAAYISSMFKNYFKFAFVRRPEERLISCWQNKVLDQNYFNFSSSEHSHYKELDNFLSFVETLNVDICDEHLRSQNSLIDLNNLDFLGRFENFNEDLRLLIEKIGVKNYTIPHLNASKKKNLVLTQTQKERIYKIYEKDYRIFYPFG